MSREKYGEMAADGFTRDQMDEIQQGQMAGLDISVYARKDFLAIQMRQIRLGLLNDVDVEKYADPAYDWFQMEEIRLGLEHGIHVDSYSSPDITYDRMRQVRKGLECGIDLSKFVRLKAGIIRQLRKACISKVNIVDFIQEGYDADQLDEIRKYLELGVDARQYFTVEYRSMAIRQICEGVAEGLEVEAYADVYYNWRQMQEIRFGLEKRLDISAYKNPLYSWQQMKEIRLGLENGIDVTVYKSFMYTAQEMKRRRLVLEEQEYLPEQIQEQIVKSAQAKRPENGKDGWYEYFFRTADRPTPKKLDDGSAEFSNIQWFELVEAGQEIAFYHEATPGVCGYTESGDIIPAKHGREQKILTGKGFTLDPDGRTYRAAMSGKIELCGEQLDVSKLLIVTDVSTTSGNINFDGSVYVKGNVGTGVRIEATGDVAVDGNVEDAIIECGGTVFLKKGMNAGGIGYIRAGKNVIGGFFESTKIFCGQDIWTRYCMNCELYIEGTIYISDANGSLIGGSSYAVQGMRVASLGNHISLPTYVRIGVNDNITNRVRQMEKSISGVEQELTILRNAYRDFHIKYSAETRNTMEVFLKLEDAIYTKELEMEHLMTGKRQMDEDIARMQTAKAVIKNDLYEGVTMDINGIRWTSRKLKAVTIKNVGQRVAVFSN